MIVPCREVFGERPAAELPVEEIAERTRVAVGSLSAPRQYTPPSSNRADQRAVRHVQLSHIPLRWAVAATDQVSSSFSASGTAK
ncbi:hypothetical protein [Nocardia abscessus]|uniref:hypothetical protein n=1 Tax=Nocardia abscessus TaxID=120957 RepID=UPI0024580835|nr:hypothetical protein [Nocardia abscessus]